MSEIVFWILVSFFSAVGVVEILSHLKRVTLDKKISPPFVVIPQKNDALGADTQLRYIFSQLNFNSRVIVADIGLNEQGRQVLTKLEKELPITVTYISDIPKIIAED